MVVTATAVVVVMVRMMVVKVVVVVVVMVMVVVVVVGAAEGCEEDQVVYSLKSRENSPATARMALGGLRFCMYGWWSHRNHVNMT